MPFVLLEVMFSCETETPQGGQETRSRLRRNLLRKFALTRLRSARRHSMQCAIVPTYNTLLHRCR